MKALFIGGSGNISSAVSQLALLRGMDLFHLNRGIHVPVEGVTRLNGDISQTSQLISLLSPHHWDVVVNWIAFTPEDIERDYLLFRGKTSQYIFIGSASSYQKPPMNSIITESTPLKNPFWDYSRNKIACEEKLMELYRQNDFPVTIVRPSHTYHTVIPIALGGWNEYTTIDRMKRGVPVVVHGDGTSLWTLTHADDFARGFIGLMGNPHSIGEAFHITSDEVMSWNCIYEMLGASIGVKPHLVHIASESIVKFAQQHNGPDVSGTLLGDKSHSAIFDNSKIKRFVTDYKAVIPFHEGIKRTLEWFEAKQERKIINPQTNRFLNELISHFTQSHTFL